MGKRPLLLAVVCHDSDGLVPGQSYWLRKPLGASFSVKNEGDRGLEEGFFAVKWQFYKLLHIIPEIKGFVWELTKETSVVPVAGCVKKLNVRFGRDSVITWSMHQNIMAKAKGVKDCTSTFCMQVKESQDKGIIYMAAPDSCRVSPQEEAYQQATGRWKVRLHKDFKGVGRLLVLADLENLRTGSWLPWKHGMLLCRHSNVP